MSKMIKLETHLHTAYGSSCGKVKKRDVLNMYEREGFGGIVVTEHYNLRTFNNFYSQQERSNLHDRFLLGFRKLKDASLKIKIFFGIELTIKTTESMHFLIYGLNEQLFKKLPYLIDKTQEEIFKLCDENNLFFVQAHPYRKGSGLGNPKFMHAVEVYNSNKRKENHNDLAFKMAKTNNLKMMSGSDFHEKEDLAGGGILIPNSINTEQELATYLIKNNAQLLKSGQLYSPQKR